MGLNDVSGSVGHSRFAYRVVASFSCLARPPIRPARKTGYPGRPGVRGQDLNSAAQTVQQTVTSAQSAGADPVSQINQLVGQVQQYNQQIAIGVKPGAPPRRKCTRLWNRFPILRRSPRSRATTAVFRSPWADRRRCSGGISSSTCRRIWWRPAADAANPQGDPTLQIVDGRADVTGSITGGQLGG